MLEVKCEEYLAKVRAKAAEMGIRGRLEKQLEYLATYACQERADATKCVLMSDHAPLSFYFLMQRRQENGSYMTWFDGGCIFYSPGDTGVGSPQFSVRFGEDTSKADWSIHT